MIKPAKRGPVRRRVVTVSIYALGFTLLSVLSPIWLVLVTLVGVLRRRRFVILRLLVFAWFYFGFELIALLLVAWVFIVRRAGEPRMEALYRLQAWWATVNLRLAQKLLRIRFVVEGANLTIPGPTILLVRHASILDTLLPCAFVQRAHGLRIRYVLKQELLFDPCIDIVGNALPNYFVDRSGDTSRELQAVRSLVDNLGEDAVLLFPEGTRFSEEKRANALTRLEAQSSELHRVAQSLACVLPPRPGGVLTVLDALPEVDCVFVAHTGLESFAKVIDLLSGEIVASTVRVRFWRIAASEIPTRSDERLRWLYAQWGKVDRFVRNTPETT